MKKKFYCFVLRTQNPSGHLEFAHHPNAKFIELNPNVQM